MARPFSSSLIPRVQFAFIRRTRPCSSCCKTRSTDATISVSLQLYAPSKDPYLSSATMEQVSALMTTLIMTVFAQPELQRSVQISTHFARSILPTRLPTTSVTKGSAFVRYFHLAITPRCYRLGSSQGWWGIELHRLLDKRRLASRRKDPRVIAGEARFLASPFALTDNAPRPSFYFPISPLVA